MSIMVVLTFIILGCGNNPTGPGGNSRPDSRLNGTWVTIIQPDPNLSKLEVIFNRGTGELFYRYPIYTGPYSKFSYTTNNNVLTRTPTHWHGGFWRAIYAPFPQFSNIFSDRWYTVDEFMIVLRQLYPTLTDEQFYDSTASYRDTTSSAYSISGNTLTWGVVIYTKK